MKSNKIEVKMNSRTDLEKKLEWARQECEAFGSYDEAVIECYICEKEAKDLNKLCKKIVKKTGRFDLIKKEKEKKEVLTMEKAVNFKGNPGTRPQVSADVIEAGLAVIRNRYKREGSKVRKAMEDLVKGIGKTEFLEKYNKQFRLELKELTEKRGFKFYAVKEENNVWLQLVKEA